MIEIVLPPLQRLLLQGGTVLLVGVVTWFAAMPRAIQEGYARAGRPSEGAAESAKLAARAHRIAIRVALVLLLGWALRLPVQLIGFRDPFVPLSEDLNLLVLQTSWGTIWIGQGVVILLLLTALFAVHSLKSLSTRDSERSVNAAPQSGGLLTVLPLIAATALVVLSLSLSSHALAVTGSPVIAVLADTLHATATGMWIGLLATLLLLRPDPAGDAFILQLRRFSTIALVAVPLVILAGVILGQFHVPGWPDLWETTYGRILLAKVGLAGIAMLLGFLNWRTGIPRLEDPQVRATLRRRASLEVSVAVGVLVLTAILTGTARPADLL